MHRTVRMFACLVLLASFVGSANVQAEPVVSSTVQQSDDELIARLRRATQDRVRIARHAETGKVRLIRTDAQHAVARPQQLATTATSETAARAFLADYGALFGLRDQVQELRLLRSEVLQDRSFVRFQQLHGGVPVIGGELIVQLDVSRNLLSINGEILPDLRLRITPSIDEATALAHGRSAVAKAYGVAPAALRASKPQLSIFNPALLGGPGVRRSTLAWQLELSGESASDVIREFVLIDAATGIVTLHFNQIADAKIRRVCDANNVIDNDGDETNDCDSDAKAERLEGDPVTGNSDIDLAYDYSGDTYEYYFTNFGRDSLDNAGLPLVSLVRYCPDAFNCPFANAFWDGQQMTYGDGFAVADDVVGHELSHGLTEYTSHLFYYYQSGAINESLSDVFGEFIDLTNNAGSDTPDDRWLLGEDLPVGAIRNMQDPPAFGDPDRTGSANYVGNEIDGGGVHTNSGVNNKAAFLMTDGGTFNGYTIMGLGVAKVGQIYYRVESQLLTSASDYQDLGDALQTACASLVGSYDITANDCGEVTKVVQATEMDTPPVNAAAVDAPVCAAGQTVNDIFFDDFEDTASGNWTSLALIGDNAWYYPANANPLNFDAQYATSGVQNVWGFNTAGTPSLYDLRMTFDLSVPEHAYLHFRHAFAFEKGLTSNYDGGVVRYSTDGGTTWTDAGALFTDNGYNSTITQGFGNPLAGQPAFGGVSRGYISSRADLNALAGQNVRFAFEIGVDNIVAALGWFIDDVRMYTCSGTAINTAPTINTFNNLHVVQGGASVSAEVATVNDDQDAVGDLSVALSGAPAGMQVSLTNTDGTISATVEANCTAAPGSYSLTLTVTDSEGLADSAGLTVVVDTAGQLIQDSGFEAGSPSPVWTEGSTNFGTPLCTVATCGSGAGTAGPRSGTVWAWFGGVTGRAESGYIAQAVDLPAGPAELRFYLWIGHHNGTGAASYLRVLIDGVEVFKATDATSDYDADYTPVTVDLSAFSGGSRSLRIESFNPSAFDAFTANLDDVTLTTSNNVCNTPPVVSLHVDDQLVSENVGSVVVQAELNRISAQQVLVPLDFAGTASSGDDYSLVTDTITIPAGALTGTLTLGVIDDALNEADESVIFAVRPSATISATATQTVTVLDNDPMPTLSFETHAVNVAEAVGSISVAVRLNQASGRQISVPLSFEGTASADGSDYDIAAQSITIAPGTLTGTAIFDIIDDTLIEPDETIILNLGAPTNATLGAVVSQTITIQDNDALPELVISQNAFVVDEQVGTLSMTVQLSKPSTNVVSVDYATGGGTASAGSDYTAQQGRLLFAPGTTRQTLIIPIMNDADDEFDETFEITFSAPNNVRFGSSTSVKVTIKANDQPKYRLWFPVVRHV